MLTEGLYGFDYRATTDAPQFIGTALAVLRNGKILGTDRCGSVFMGSYEYVTECAMNRVRIRMTVAPEVELVTGFRAGADGAMIDFEALLAQAQPGLETMVELAGRPVMLKLTYIGPLPDCARGESQAQ